VTESLKTGPAASDGNIDQWINVLGEAAKDDAGESRFLTGLRDFLNEEAISLSRILEWWGRCCDVPGDAKKTENPKTIQAMRYINSFRNRFAHVPFPHDTIGELAQALEDVTEQLFSIKPQPSKHEEGSRSSPLTGCFDIGGHRLRGNMSYGSKGSSQEINFMFPAFTKKEDEVELWPAHHIIFVDSMMRPHILTRIRDDQGTGEYTRFRAEANAVIIRYESSVFETIGKPKASDYETEENEDIGAIEDSTKSLSFTEAIDAIRKEDFDSSIAYFTEITKTRRAYHVAWLRLGHAKREKAVRLPDEENQQAVELLKEAVADFGRATHHVSRDYQATAYYERSKAYYQLYKRDNQLNEHLDLAGEDAERSCDLSSDPKYWSWLEFIDQYSKGHGSKA
jgi:hypothetical protein